MRATRSEACVWTEPGMRRLALMQERLIDVDEWCEVRVVSAGLPYPAALTLRLVAAIERIPFRRVGKTTEGERGLAILRRAAAALAQLDALRQEDPSRCLVVPFSAAVPSCTHDGWRMLKLHCGPAEDGKPWIVLGMGDELDGCALDAPCPARAPQARAGDVALRGAVPWRGHDRLPAPR